MKNTLHTVLLRFFVLLSLAAAGYSQPASISSDPKQLSFQDVLEGLEDTPVYGAALLEYEKVLLEEKSLAHPGDLVFSLEPGVRSTMAELMEPDQTTLDLEGSVLLILGRSLLEEEKYREARRQSQTEVLSLNNTRSRTILNLFGLYSDLWILQEEGALLSRELDLASAKYEANLQLYAGGAVSLAILEQAEEELRLQEEAYSDNLLDQRLTWFELQKERGASTDMSPLIPRLAPVTILMTAKEKPLQLLEQALSADNTVQEKRDSLQTLKENVSRLEKADLDMDLAPLVSYGDYDFSMNYNWENRALNVKSTIPLAEWGSSSSQGGQDFWTFGLSLGLSLGAGKKDSLDAYVLEKEIRRQEILLEDQINSIALELRTTYQKYLQAQENYSVAERGLIRLERLKDAVDTRYDAGQALKLDRDAAELALKRGLWKVQSARAEVQKTYLALAAMVEDITSYL